MDVSTGEGGKANRCRPDVHATWRREKQFLNSLDDKRLHPALLTASSHTQTPYTSATVIINRPLSKKTETIRTRRVLINGEPEKTEHDENRSFCPISHNEVSSANAPGLSKFFFGLL